MRYRFVIVFLLFIGFAHSSLQAQDLSHTSLRVHKIATNQDSIRIDSLSIVKGSVSLAIDSASYLLLPEQSLLIWKKRPTADSIDIRYRVIPYALTATYFHKDIQRMNRNILMPNYYYDANEANKNQFIDFGTLDYSGTFGRNLSFGNNQDVVLNSQFNLQLEGDLGDSIKLSGAITDNSIPFQPDGNTQQIQEFDRVFIQLSKRKSKLIVGDYNLNRPNSYFMNFYKRVQGAYVSHTYKTSKQGEATTAVGASIAKGKFVRNILTALEGNQGPYKLSGPNGEIFFIVLANTEKVFIDGVLQNRGEDRDYIIDYNTGEVTFMPKRLITKDSRIVVEFEFTDRNYLNSLFYLNQEWKVNNKMQVFLNAYSNQDARNQPIQQTLDSSQKYFLSTIGDSIRTAFYPGVQQVDSFSASKILYKKIDSVVNGITYTNVYVYSTNADSAKYSLTFNQVGQGYGNYKPAINSANGRVYAWIAPVAGIPQGDYEPVYILVTPKKQQMFTVGGQYQIDSFKKLLVEGALSSADPNLFSTRDNQTHQGTAAKVSYEDGRVLSTSRQLQLFSKWSYEYVDERFRPLERFRNVEFARDWNIPSINTFETEHLGSAFISLKKSSYAQLDYKFGTYHRGTQYAGSQHQASLLFNKHGYHVLAKGDVMQQKAHDYQSAFYRPIVELEKECSTLRSLVLGTKMQLEHNTLKNASGDSLLARAFSFDIINLYARSNKRDNNYQFEFIQRRDRAVKNNQFQQSTLGHTYSLSASVLSFMNHEIRLTSAYRILNITDTTLTPLKPDETLLGRLDYNFRLGKGLCVGNVLYEFGSGQELKREFAYVEVPIGQGQYVWRDYNGDGLQQLNEFELAIFPDEKRFIRVFTPTNQYIKAKYAQYNQSISINPRSIISDARYKGFRKALGMLFLQSSVQLNNRFVGSNGIEQYNPFTSLDQDSLLLQSAATVVNSVFLNRMSNQWGFDFIHSINSGRTLLTYGIDKRSNREQQWRARYNASKQVMLGGNWKYGQRNFTSQFLETRNYRIHYQVLEPSLTAMFRHNQVRLVSGYKYDVRKNDPQLGNEKALAQSLQVEGKYNILSSGSIGARLTYTTIQFNGISNSTIGYTMLDGLQKGKNWIWHISFDRRLSKSVEMTLEYDGRKSPGSTVIHTGRASVRAVF